MASSWFTQYKTFLWKNFQQRLRSPGTTIVELILPCIFMLLLAIGYWRSTTNHIPPMDFTSKPPTNFSTLLPAFFCQNISSVNPFGRRLPIGPCIPETNTTICFPFVRDGALCVRDEGLLSKVMMGVYYAKGSAVIPTLDSYLALSAFTTYESRKMDPTFFSRSGQASLSHYGYLLLVDHSNNFSMAKQFNEYCTNISILCEDIIYMDQIFTSMSEAQDFVKDNDGKVWAIVELQTPNKESWRKGKIFTISMNYTATPWTFTSTLPFTKGLGSNDYMLYITSGFLTLQNIIQQFFIKMEINNFKEISSSNVNISDILKYTNLYGPPLIPMPSPPYEDNSFYSQWIYFMPLFAMLAALFPVTRLVSWIVEEKSLMIRESMQIMGLRWSCMSLGWFTSALLTDIVSSLLASFVLHFSFFNYVNFGILFFLYFSFMQQNSALSLFLSTFFTNPRIAGAVAGLTIFLCSMPFYSFPDGMSTARLFGECLIPCVAYAVSFNQLATYASFGYKFTWSNTRDGDFSIAAAIGMMWASSAAMLILWLYLDQVLSCKFGRRRHPLFFLSPLRRLFCNRSHNKENDINKRNIENGSVLPSRGESNEDITSTSSDILPLRSSLNRDENDKRFGAVFRELRKEYESGGIIGWLYTFFTGLVREGDHCVAVRDVSFNLEYGKVHVLLGANGSGKSTIMGIATGMIEPTKGEVYICGHDAMRHLAKCRENIGYCPQTDIVWGRLTVEQHLSFYARMKGNGVWNVQEQVNQMLISLNLEEKRLTSAENLSGGQRRRLCVGIALIGDPAVLFLDEPTAGMDMQGRRAVYDALEKNREKRAVMISTHLLDEADRVGDQILLMQTGVLRGAGSSLFLKSKTGVGYVVTCVVDSCLSEMEENVCISSLTELVRNKAYSGHYPNNPNEIQAIPPGCKLLGIERRGREISFRFPLSLLSSAGINIIRGLESQREALRLRSIGLSLTTLQDVLDSIADNQQSSDYSLENNNLTSIGEPEKGISIQMEGNTSREPFLGSTVCEDENDGFGKNNQENTNNNNNNNIGKDEYNEEYYNDENNRNNSVNIYDDSNHYTRKGLSFNSHFSALFMKRVHYAKRDFCLVLFQVILPVLFLGVALLIDLVNPKGQPALTLDASLYDKFNSPPYSEIKWTTSSELSDVFGVNNINMENIFGSYYTPLKVQCDVNNCSSILSNSMIPDIMNHSSSRNIAISLTSLTGNNGVPASIIMHNASSPHAGPQALNALYSVIYNQVFSSNSTMTARNDPMPMGPNEEKMVGALRRVIFGIFILLPFTFIPSNTVSYMVRENQSGSRHLQWLAGANVFAYWLSSMIFDFCCFLFTEALAMLIFVIFKRTEFIGDSYTVGATITLFTVFGLSSIPFSYVLSFFFNSPFVAQSVVLIANFALGFLWVMGEQIIGPIDGLENFMLYTTYILRVIPSVCFGEGMFVLSGVELANLMMPGRPRPDLYAVLHFIDGKFKGGLGTGLIYMPCTFVGSILILVILEYARIQRFSWIFTNISCIWCRGKEKENSNSISNNNSDNNSSSFNNIYEIDESVAREEAEVCQNEGGRPMDCITLQHLTKKYHGTNHAAVKDISLGVHKGEIMALLGLNGAGKTTTVGVLAGEIVPSSGSALINHLSVLRSASRSYVGYCPQKDALLDNLSPQEHLTLYARLRGASDIYIHKEIPRLMHALGLTPTRHRPAHTLSGGNKRRLSLAMALVGGTTSVLLDEPTAGMDALARRQTCAVVRRLTRAKSVILTTHLLDETEALADRVAFLARGRLRCVGTPQELKARFTDDAVYAVRVVFAGAHAAYNSEIVSRLCDCFRRHGSGDDNNNNNNEETCVVIGRVGGTITLSVRQSLSSICSATAAIREGLVEGIPPVIQVSASQPTLEDILLKE